MAGGRGGSRRNGGGDGFGWSQLLLCLAAALPLAIIYRQWLIPTLAGTNFVRWAKSLSSNDVAHGVGNFIMGWTPKEVDDWASAQGHKMDGLLLFLARQNPWLLGAGAIGLLIALSCCEDWCSPRRRRVTKEDLPPEMAAEFADIEKEMEELEKELAEMEDEWTKNNPEEAAKLAEERRAAAAAKAATQRQPADVQGAKVRMRQRSRYYRKPRSAATGAVRQRRGGDTADTSSGGQAKPAAAAAAAASKKDK